MSRNSWRHAPDESSSAGGTPGPADSAAASPRKRRRKRRRTVAVAVVVLAIVFSTATVRLFIWPDRGMPARVSAIVMMDGPGDRLDTALNLAWQQRAPFLVISRGSAYWGHGSVCAPRIAHVQVICFDPSPSTTRGEAEFAGRLARRYHWQSVVLVTTTPQDSRARLRVERCFTGPVYVMTAALPLRSGPDELADESGATVKALIVGRGC